MAKYVYLYKGGGTPASEEESKRLLAAWQRWLGGLDGDLIDAGNPFGASTAVGG